MRLRHRPGMAVPVVIGILVSAAACSSSGGTTTPPTLPASAPGVTTTAPAAAAPTTTAPADSSGLSGTWSGQYGGAYSGTFTVTWQQTGTSLSGTIKISAPPQTLPITGSVSGGTIQFGTVGSTAISYSGTVSGSSMSGSYTFAGVQGGSWSASKSS